MFTVSGPGPLSTTQATNRGQHLFSPHSRVPFPPPGDQEAFSFRFLYTDYMFKRSHPKATPPPTFPPPPSFSLLLKHLLLCGAGVSTTITVRLQRFFFFFGVTTCGPNRASRQLLFFTPPPPDPLLLYTGVSRPPPKEIQQLGLQSPLPTINPAKRTPEGSGSPKIVPSVIGHSSFPFFTVSLLFWFVPF